MGFFRQLLATPASWFYSAGVGFRHTLFDWGILKSIEFDIPIVCVGNITVGGTGKTPMAEHLVEQLSKHYNVAVLSRGYKRKTKGFILSTPDMSFKRIGDEPKQIKLKFPSIPVAVCEKRIEGIRRLREAHPEVNLIILDDGFQHRYVEAWINIVLMDFNNPIYEDRMLPLGRLRDVRSSLERAGIFVITKCPDTLSPLDCRMVRKYLDLYPYQSIYFSKFKSADAMPLFTELTGNEPLKDDHPVIAVASIANPDSFLEHLERKYTLMDKAIFPDHHIFRMRDVDYVEQLLAKAPQGTVLVMTEKDAVKFMNSRKIKEATRRAMYYVSINVEFFDDQQSEFHRILSQYVSENQKYNITHPE